MPDDTPSGAGAANDPVLVRRQGPLLVLTLNRPERLNAVSLPLYRRLLEELEAAEADDAVRCVLLTGSGRAFCVGADLKAHGEGPPTDSPLPAPARSPEQRHLELSVA